MTVLGRVVAYLQGGGLEAEQIEQGAILEVEGHAVGLMAEVAQGGGVLVQLHLDLDLFVEEEALDDILMATNLLNQTLDYGTLTLEPVPVDDPDEDTPLAFAVLGRAALWLTELSEAELGRLHQHLLRFTHEVAEAMERTLHGEKGMRA